MNAEKERDAIAAALEDDENLWRDMEIACTYADRARNILAALTQKGYAYIAIAQGWTPPGTTKETP